jgi:hypothetical protein
MNLPRHFLRKPILVSMAVLFLYAAPLLAADTIRASVYNASTGKPSSGDEAVLLALADGMQVESRSRTDDRGSVTLQISFPGTQHVVRVLHDGVNYDQFWTNGPVPEIKVFDAARKVTGVAGYATIIKLESDGSVCRVTELHAINNESSPPRTQNTSHNLEVSLPEKAEMDSVVVAGPEGLPIKITPVRSGSDPSHYMVPFPLRPGMTRYVIHYHLPYSARLVFHPRLTYPVRQLTVAFPASMNFTPLDKRRFHSIINQDGVQVQAMNQVPPGTLAGFIVSGVGAFPPAQTASAGKKSLPEGPQSAAQVRDNYGKLPASGVPVEMSQQAVGAVLIGIFAILGIGVFLARRRQKSAANWPLTNAD